MWGIIPAAGTGSRIQPLAFSKELLPVGSVRENGGDRPRAVSEYLVERMVLGGATKICFVIAPGKSDIVEYYGAGSVETPVCYVVQPEPSGLCDAIFRALPLVDDGSPVLVGLPDTIWFPENGLASLHDAPLSLLCFPVEEPQRFDAVVMRDDGSVVEIQVKRTDTTSHWIWGAIKIAASTFHELHALWQARGREDVYVGTLVNAWLALGNRAVAVRAGTSYVDTGTLDGYRQAMQMVDGRPASRSDGHVTSARVANGRRGFPSPAGAR